MKWPPDPHKARIEAITRNRAWWSGEKLKENSGTSFWAEPERKGRRVVWTPAGERTHRIHVPVAADLAQTSSDMLFGGDLDILGPKELQGQIDDIRPWFDDLLSDAADRASGLGEIYLRLGWADGEAKMSVIDPDMVIPSWKWGRIYQVDVWHVLPDYQDREFRHVERYELGKITHLLFLKDKTDEWNSISLDAHPETAAFVETPEIELPAGMGDRLAIKGVMNRRPRKKRIGGAADTEGSEDVLAGIDEAITSLMRDVRLSKSRVIVDESMLQRSAEALGGVSFDTTAEIFAPLNIGGSAAKSTATNGIEVIHFPIRVEAHLETARELTRKVVAAAGFAPESLISDQSSLPEAAAARRLREAPSLRTTARKARRWKPVIAEAMSDLLIINAWLSEDGEDTQQEGQQIQQPEIDVSLGSSISPDISELITTVGQAKVAGIVSLKTSVQMLHPDWDDVQIDAEVEAIKAEAPVSLL